jgi:hypothetical protein
MGSRRLGQNRGARIRWLLVVLAYVLLPAPARSADLKIEDLYGLSINATAIHHGAFRLGEKQGPGEITVRWNVRIDNQGIAETNLRREVKTPRRTGQLSRSHKGAIGQPGKVGDGHFVWVLKGDGWTCNLQSSMAREVGASDSRAQSAIASKVTIIGMKQVSSSCQASKKG